MGAEFATLSPPGSLSQAEVRAKFKEAQDDDCYQNGHSYSGGLGMAAGLTFRSETFPDSASAEAWLMNHAEKWEDALAVKHNTLEAGDMYLIGAWCSS